MSDENFPPVQFPPKGCRLFQINADDLADLERLMPQLIGTMYRPGLDNTTRIKVRRIQQILSDVRWNYGPPSEVIVIPVDDPTP